jgi:hypothetical protein
VLSREDDRTSTYCGYMLNCARYSCMKCHNIYFAALLISGPAVYSGKYFSSATCNGAKTRSQDGTHMVARCRRHTLGSLPLKMWTLLRKRMIDVRRNHRGLITLPKRTSDSAIRFCGMKGAIRGNSTKR